MEMLLWQATRQVELFYGVSAPVGVMRTALVGN
jgi:shikimate 5-dehydrogenase